MTSSNTQSGSANKLVQVGRDYIRYISVNLDSGNWGVLVINTIVALLVMMGLGTAARATYDTGQTVMAETGIIEDPNDHLCTPELAMLNLQIARYVADLEARGQLNSAIVADLPELEALQGPPGPVGPQGEPGPVGTQGTQGERGPQGERGETGEQGIQGEKGDQGERGEQGPAGPQGESGPQGEKGEPGTQGPVGPQGELGPQGQKGEPGLPGEQGLTGAQGLTGERGETGEQGPPGIDGSPGISQKQFDALASSVNELQRIVQNYQNRSYEQALPLE